MTAEQQIIDRIKIMNGEYKQLTGHDAYLYAYAPEDRTSRFVFSTYAHHFRSNRAILHMQEILDLARKGRTHDQITHGMPRE